jgi:hypothetical protein
VSPRLDVQLDRDTYAPADLVRGSVLVLEGGSARSLEVFLRYCEKTADYEHDVVTLRSGELNSGELVTGASHAFAITLPPDALPAYASKHAELFWELDAKSDALGRDTHERVRLDVRSREDE